MSVYVDDARIPWRRGIKMSHLTADSLEELLAFGRRLGLKRQWLQNVRCPHFDISEAMRSRAVGTGASETSAREVARIARAAGDAWAHQRQVAPRDGKGGGAT